MATDSPFTFLLANQPYRPEHLFALEQRWLARTRETRTSASGAVQGADYEGCLSLAENKKQAALAAKMAPLDYYLQFVSPTEGPALEQRLSARDWVKHMHLKAFFIKEKGPLFCVHGLLLIPGREHQYRELGIIGQNHKLQRGIFQPEHHLQTIRFLRYFEKRRLPVITFMDTPGADAGAHANANLQAHAISRLITAFVNVRVPTVGIICGAGNSGGAIPYATTDRILCMEDAYMSTIHPAALADIVKRLGMTKEQCAKAVRISAYELCQDGLVDGVIKARGCADAKSALDMVPALEHAIVSALKDIADSPAKKARDLLSDLRRAFPGYLAASDRQAALEHGDLAAYFNTKSADARALPAPVPLFSDFLRRMERSLNLRVKLRFTNTAHHLSLAESAQVESSYTLKTQSPQLSETQAAKEYIAKLGQVQVSFLPDDFQRAIRNEFGSHPIRDIFEFKYKEKRIKRRKHRIAYQFMLFLLSAHKSKTPQFLEHFIHHLSQAYQAAPSRVSKESPANLAEIIPIISKQLLLHAHKLIQLFALTRYCLDHVNDIIPLIRREHEFPRQAAEALVTKVLAADKEVFLRWVLRNRHVHGRAVDMIIKALKRLYPRIPAELLIIMDAILTVNIPSLSHGKYKAKVTPKNTTEDYWLKLDRAYKDTMIANMLARCKAEKKYILVDDILAFFTDFNELDADIVSCNPSRFPEFSNSIRRAISKPYANSIVTGTARFAHGKAPGTAVGLIISNSTFQAGSIDMASGEKIARAFSLFGKKGLPVIMFISSGGMQTKEGTGSLFCMSIANDVISKFVQYTGLPVVCFGYRDCTGGAQASFVTHPDVYTFYLSGTELPFAGARVVPEPLPYPCRLANYLVDKDNAMTGLVKNPWDTFLDKAFIELGDPELKIPKLSIPDVIANILAQEEQALSGHAQPAVTPQRRIPRKTFTKVMIPNRGDIALSLIKKLRRKGITPILGHSRTDSYSLAYTQASIYGYTVELGPGPVSQSYLKMKNIIQAAKTFGAEAIHPGIGFLAENAAFARLCEQNGLIFIGPASSAIELMGDKAKAREIMQKAGIPVVPGSDGVVHDADTAARICKDIGFPVMLKAAFGGGGRGMRQVFSANELTGQFHEAYLEAKSAFGDGALYIEKLIQQPRHIEVQILADRYGKVLVLGERDCTVQRNHQKLIEESPSPVLPQKLRERIFAYAKQAVEASGYYNAGTVEFIMDMADRSIYFMEMNTRLQVEYGVTEAVTGIDIISEQIQIAQGLHLRYDSDEMPPKGYAVECRINAETVQANGETVPRTGLIETFSYPKEDYLRVDTFIYPGYRIPPYYDSMIAKFIVHAADRSAGIARMVSVLQRTRITGCPTNIALQTAILQDKTFAAGAYTTHFLPDFFKTPAFQNLASQEAEAQTGGQNVIRKEDMRIPDTNMLKVPAFIDGVFYRSSNPKATPFFAEGDHISPDDTIGLFESMKKYYPIKLCLYTVPDDAKEAPLYDHPRYRIVQFLVADGCEVEKNQPVIVIEPV